MLSDEERKAIEWVKNNLEETIKLSQKYGLQEAIKYQTTILNLIEKQSKEIEELKEYKHDAELTKIACCTAQNCEALNNCIKLERELQNADKKWEDKIKAKIEEEDELFFKTKDVRHANRYKAYKELLEKE